MVDSPEQKDHPYSTQEGTGDQRSHVSTGGVLKSIDLAPETQPPNSKWWQKPRRIEHIIQALTLLFVGAYTVITLCLFLDTRQANRAQLVKLSESVSIADQSLKAVQRAFVIISDFNLVPIPDAKVGPAWQLSPNFENVGATGTESLDFLAVDPQTYWLVRSGETKSDMDRAENTTNGSLTRPFIRHRDFLMKRDWKIGSPNDPEEIDLGNREVQTLITPSATLGPKQKIPVLDSGGYRLTIENVNEATSQTIGRFYYGIARYTDIFHVKHVTKYCFRMDGMIRWQDEPAKPFIKLCRHWNCTDDQCKEDRARYDAEVAAFTAEEATKPPDIPK